MSNSQHSGSTSRTRHVPTQLPSRLTAPGGASAALPSDAKGIQKRQGQRPRVKRQKKEEDPNLAQKTQENMISFILRAEQIRTEMTKKSTSSKYSNIESNKIKSDIESNKTKSYIESKRKNLASALIQANTIARAHPHLATIYSTRLEALVRFNKSLHSREKVLGNLEGRIIKFIEQSVPDQKAFGQRLQDTFDELAGDPDFKELFAWELDRVERLQVAFEQANISTNDKTDKNPAPPPKGARTPGRRGRGGGKRIGDRNGERPRNAPALPMPPQSSAPAAPFRPAVPPVQTIARRSKSPPRDAGTRSGFRDRSDRFSIQNMLN